MTTEPAPAAAPAAPASAEAPAPQQQSAQQGGTFLSGSAQQPGNGRQPAAPATPSAKPTGFFRDEFAKDGKFIEGWSKNLSDAGFQRLASKALTAKDEAGLFRMLDDVIGFASKKTVARPTAGASDQELSDFRRLVGAPEAANAYEFKPGKVPDGMEWDDASAAAFQELAYKHHVPAEFMKEASAFYVGVMEKQQAAAQERMTTKIGELAAASEGRFKKEWGEDYDSRLEANKAFVTARKLDVSNPIVAAALSHPDIVALIDEARRASREAPLPGIKQEVFTGSASPRQQAQEIMKQDRNWKNDPEKSRRVRDLYAQESAMKSRRTARK